MEENTKNKKVKNNIHNKLEDTNLNVLLPKLLDKNDVAYKSVEELNKAITLAMKEKRVRNIALTGPYGSGKSSILQTFRRDHEDDKDDNGKNKYKILNISLATLQSDDNIQSENIELENVEESNVPNGKDNKGDSHPEYPNKQLKKNSKQENLSRRIEYSILQQIIYKEEYYKTPNSRFSRIIHIESKELYKRSLYLLLFVITLIIAFEPKFLRIETIYNALNLGRWNIWVDAFCLVYILLFLFNSFKKIISLCPYLKFNKLNISGNSIELLPNTSIFNKHFDEILYFFQANPYNVVIIEDLDRFKNPDLFLKLREVNFLLNESNAIKQHIVFVYAVKDDVFINEDRTKFFDYIITVIPVVNPYNSKALLKKALAERGYNCKDEKIKDNDLSEIAFFIQDMRILNNIANEYKQYRENLCAESYRLDHTKLLAMIVYKNYEPNDFALLHKCQGAVYKCIASRNIFIKKALENIEKKELALNESKRLYNENKHLRENELRYIFLHKLGEYNRVEITNMALGRGWHSIKEISETPELFNLLMNGTHISCNNGYYNIDIDFDYFDELIKFSDRMAALTKDFEKEEYDLRKERLYLEQLSIADLILKYDIERMEEYQDLGLSPIMNEFIKLGYIDEDYYDYISFYYDGITPPGDYGLLRAIRLKKTSKYDYPINKIENFVKVITPRMFNNNAILNNSLLDYIATKSLYNKYFDLFMNIIEKEENSPLDFLSQYYLHGKQQKVVFEHFIKWNRKDSWEMICKWKNEDERNNLIEAWIKYAGELDDTQKEWLSDKYNFIVERCDRIELKRCKEIVSQCCFKEINSYEKEILDSVIENNSYDINPINLMIILGHLKYPHITVDQIDLTKITDIGNEKLTSYIKDNITGALGCFSKTSKEESPENMLYLLLHPDLTNEQKEDYLSVQMNMLNDEDLPLLGKFSNLAFKLKIVKPSWKNIYDYLLKCQDRSIMFDYIKHFTELLSMDYVSSEQPYGKKLFDTVFASNDLDIDSYKTLCQCFKDEYFDGNNVISSLEPERLICLINNDKIPFTDGNISILKGTEVYSNYLIHNKADFLENISKVEINKPNVAKDILESDELSYSEKETVVKKIPESMMFCSPELSNSIINVILNTGLNMNEGTLKALIKTSTEEEYRVRLANKMIKDLDYDENDIDEILSLLGDKDEKIILNEDGVTLDNTLWNKDLVTTLKTKGYILNPRAAEDKKIRIKKRVTSPK